MADICACNDKKCPSRTLCYRYTCEKNKFRQAYFTLPIRVKGKMKCKEFWSNEGTPDPSDYTVTQKALRRKRISSQEYQLICDNIIAKGKPIQDTLIELLEEAGKYDLSPRKGVKHHKKQPKVRKRRKK